MRERRGRVRRDAAAGRRGRGCGDRPRTRCGASVLRRCFEVVADGRRRARRAGLAPRLLGVGGAVAERAGGGRAVVWGDE